MIIFHSHPYQIGSSVCLPHAFDFGRGFESPGSPLRIQVRVPGPETLNSEPDRA